MHKPGTVVPEAKQRRLKEELVSVRRAQAALTGQQPMDLGGFQKGGGRGLKGGKPGGRGGGGNNDSTKK